MFAKDAVVSLILIVAAATSVLTIIAGLGLIYIRVSSDHADVEIFGRRILTDNVGVAAIFLGVVVLTFISRRLLLLFEQIKPK
jgi:hypothetical protein